MPEVMFSRSGWLPKVIRQDGQLRLMLAAGADANHDPREFSFPISDAHRRVVEGDLARHLLLWSAILPLCDEAGIRGTLNESAAVELLDPILFAEPSELDGLFTRIRWAKLQLISYGADIELLDRGQIWAAMRSATESADFLRAQEYDADRRRADRGIVLGPLDRAILSYTGQLLHGSTIPRRKPEMIHAAVLPDVLSVVAIAEKASAGMHIRNDPRRGRRASDKADWKRMEAGVETALRRDRPELADDTVRSLSFLMCSEAWDRSRHSPQERRQESDSDTRTRTTELLFTDDNGAEKTWLPADPLAAGRSGGPHLRPLLITDAVDVLAAFTSNPDMARQGTVSTLTEADRYVADLLRPGSSHRPWVVSDQGRLVGLVCVSVDEANRSGWFWYWLNHDARGQGWMSRAAATVADWALADGGLERLELGHRVNNPASGAVARAAGFVREGTERAKFLVDGERIDVDSYGRLRSDPCPVFQPLEIIRSTHD